MISADKQELLSGFLCKLPEPVASRLAKAVEVDRLIGGQGLPHEVILGALRPQLRQAAQHERMPTPQRFFCQPFEDLLIARKSSAKQKGRIARSSILPLWTSHFCATLMTASPRALPILHPMCRSSFWAGSNGPGRSCASPPR